MDSEEDVEGSSGTRATDLPNGSTSPKNASNTPNTSNTYEPREPTGTTECSAEDQTLEDIVMLSRSESLNSNSNNKEPNGNKSNNNSNNSIHNNNINNDSNNSSGSHIYPPDDLPRSHQKSKLLNSLRRRVEDRAPRYTYIHTYIHSYIHTFIPLHYTSYTIPLTLYLLPPYLGRMSGRTMKIRVML
jgi:hypothetical protein